MKLVVQPEIAYVIIDEIETWEWYPPQGKLFVTHWQNIPDDATLDEIIKFLESLLEDCKIES